MDLTLNNLNLVTARYIKGAEEFGNGHTADDYDAFDAEGQITATNAIREAFGLPIIPIAINHG